MKIRKYFKTHVINLKEIKVHQKDNKLWLEFPDKTLKLASDRFILSLAANANISNNILKHFSYDEVFEKHTKKYGPVRIVEDVIDNKCLAITKLDTGICEFEETLQILHNSYGQDIKYDNGIIYSTHDINSTQCLIDNENYIPKVFIEIPIDGYGKTYTYLSMLRASSNSLIIGYANPFKNQVLRSKSDINAICSIQRVLDSYSNDEALDLFIKRLEIAKKSTLSIKESIQAFDILESLDNSLIHEYITNDYAKQQFNKLVGNINNKYGIVNVNVLSDKQRRLLPTDCRVSDMINFLAELFSISTLTITERLLLQSWIGKTISSEYDLENINCNITNKIFYLRN